MPILKEVTDPYAERGVVLIALNTGEQPDEIKSFLADQELGQMESHIVLDPDGTIADAFMADAIPQTVVMGKDGLVESVHVGFAGEEGLKKQLGDELDTLCAGRHLKSDDPDPASDER